VPIGNKDLIVEAIARAERGTTGEIRVHLSRRLLEKDAMRRARRLFTRFEMHQTEDRNAVLLYVNLRRHKLAVVGDEGIHHRVGDEFWKKLVHELRSDLKGTHPENAIAMAVHRIGEELAKHFPLERGARHPNKLSNEVSED
jgi:uncharacterized membrane protein